MVTDSVITIAVNIDPFYFEQYMKSGSFRTLRYFQNVKKKHIFLQKDSSVIAPNNKVPI